MRAADLRLRFFLGATVGLLATIGYRSIQWMTVSRSTMHCDCWSWRQLPFHPAWIWPYLAMFLLVGLPWFLLGDFRQVKRFAGCLLATATVGWVVFIIHPTGCARPSPEGQPFYYLALQSCDRTNNCLPCLHAAFSVLAAWTLVSDGPRFFRGRQGRVLLGILLAAIGVSSVALRQHTGVDVAAGTALGAAAAWAWARIPALRRAAQVPVPAPLLAGGARDR